MAADTPNNLHSRCRQKHRSARDVGHQAVLALVPGNLDIDRPLVDLHVLGNDGNDLALHRFEQLRRKAAVVDQDQL
jgi:hypothetical protein